MSNNNKTPAIRFKGFTDTWEQRGFSSVFEILQITHFQEPICVMKADLHRTFTMAMCL